MAFSGGAETAETAPAAEARGRICRALNVLQKSGISCNEIVTNERTTNGTTRRNNSKLE
jgi:hypothetical protein